MALRLVRLGTVVAKDSCSSRAVPCWWGWICANNFYVSYFDLNAGHFFLAKSWANATEGFFFFLLVPDEI